MPREGFKSVTIPKYTYDILKQRLNKLNRDRTYPISMTQFVTHLTKLGLENYHED